MEFQFSEIRDFSGEISPSLGPLKRAFQIKDILELLRIITGKKHPKIKLRHLRKL